MKIEVKNVKVHNDMSEETLCFSATIYVDGKKVGTVRNAGHGGCNDYHFGDYALERALGEYAKTLPPIPLPENPEPWMAAVYPMEQDLDMVIDRLVEEAETRKWKKRQCAKKTLFRRPGEEYANGEWAVIKTPYTQDVKAYLVDKYGAGVEILNETL